MHVGAGIAILVLAILYVLATGVPLFLLAFSAHKSLSYLSPRLHSSRSNGSSCPRFPAFSSPWAALSFIAPAFELTGDSSGVKMSLLLSALTLLLSFVFVLAIEPLPVTGCVTKDETYTWIKGDPAVEAAEDAVLDAEIANKAADTPSAQTPPPAPPASPAGSTNGKAHLNDHSNGKPHSSRSNGNGHSAGQNESSPCLSASVVSPFPKTDQNRPKTPGGPNSSRSQSTTSADEN